VEIGQKLKEARVNKGLTLQAVEDEIKIRRKYLQAMEEEQFHILPGPVYAKAFLRTYTRFLGLDAEEILDAYNRYFAETSPVEPSEKNPEAENRAGVSGKPHHWFYLAAAAFLVGLVLLVVYIARVPAMDSMAGKTGDEVKATEQVPPAGQQTLVEQQPASASASAVNLDLNVKSNECWMRVTVDGNPAFEGTLTAGQSKRFEGKEKINVRVGNAGAVEALLNGQNLGLLGDPGEVVSREFRAAPHG